MFLQGHYQNAYVTHDIDRAMRLIDERYDPLDWICFDPDMQLKTPGGTRQATVRAALGWVGKLQIELIQPVSGWLDHYLPYLPPDRSSQVPNFHHIAVRRDNLDAMRSEIDRLGLPLAFEGEVPGLVFIYLDARESLGHYLEYVWATPVAWEMNGWPADMAVDLP